MKRKIYNIELNKWDYYTDVYLIETIKMRDLAFTVKNHYLKDSDNNLWADFSKPMENVYNSFTKYRNIKHYLTPAQLQTMLNFMLPFTGKTIIEFSHDLHMASYNVLRLKYNKYLQTDFEDSILHQYYRAYKIASQNSNISTDRRL